MAAIENRLIIERQAKQDLQGRLVSLQMMTVSLIAAPPAPQSPPRWFIFKVGSQSSQALQIGW
jgi:hypothetical protein